MAPTPAKDIGTMANRTCIFPDCGKPHDSHGYCDSHATQLRGGRELHPLRPMWGNAECAAEPACHRPVIARGYCTKHWRAWRKYGNPPTKGQVGRRGPVKYTLNATYFDDVATEEQAYWLGFITADGCIIRTSKTFALRVELAERDGEHVQLLAAALGSDRPLWSRHRFAGASFDSLYLVESLGRLGILPRKSATAEPWAGPGHLMRHYWRGLFDGDGSIYQAGVRSGWRMSIVGSNACVEAFAIWAKGICGGSGKPRHIKGGCWVWTVGGNRGSQILARELYDGATVALERKRVRAERLMDLNLAVLQAAGNERRAATMRAAWRNGTHARSRAAPDR